MNKASFYRNPIATNGSGFPCRPAFPNSRKRMAQVLRQPRGALPHNDHLHVRIMCSEEDILEGCSDVGDKLDRKNSGSPDSRALSSLNRQIGEQKAITLRRLERLAPNDARERSCIASWALEQKRLSSRVVLQLLKGSAGAELDRALSKWLGKGQKAEEVALLIDVVERRTDRFWTRTIRALISNPQSIPDLLLHSATLWERGFGWQVTADSRLLNWFSHEGKPLFRAEAESPCANSYPTAYGSKP